MQNYPTLPMFTSLIPNDEFALFEKPYQIFLREEPDRILFKCVHDDRVEFLTQYNSSCYKTTMSLASFDKLVDAKTKGATIEEICALIIN